MNLFYIMFIIGRKYILAPFFCPYKWPCIAICRGFSFPWHLLFFFRSAAVSFPCLCHADKPESWFPPPFWAPWIGASFPPGSLPLWSGKLSPVLGLSKVRHFTFAMFGETVTCISFPLLWGRNFFWSLQLHPETRRRFVVEFCPAAAPGNSIPFCYWVPHKVTFRYLW